MNQLKRLKIVIYYISLIQMGTNAIASLLTDLSTYYRDASPAAVQFIMTFPNLFVVVICLLSPFISRYISKKTMCMIGCALTSCGGVMAFFFHARRGLLYAWGAMIGTGIGLAITTATSLISMNYKGEEQARTMGLQASFANMGSALMTIVSGLLARHGWPYGYLVFLIALPGVFLSAGWIPHDERKNTHTRKLQLNKRIYACCLTAFIAAMLFNVGPANIGMYIIEKKIMMGTSILTGIASACFLIGGILFGFLFGKLQQKIRDYTVSVGFGLLILGFAVIVFSGDLLMICIGGVIAGGSLSLIMPRMILGAASKDDDATILGTACIVASSNLGILVTPVITLITSVISGTSSVKPRYITAIIVAFIMIVASLIINTKKKNCLVSCR